MLLNTIRRFSVVMGCALLTGCGATSSGPDTAYSSASTPAALPDTAVAGSASSGDVMRTGDKFLIRLTGVPTDSEYNIEMQVPTSGEITQIPLIKNQSFHAAGRTTSDLAADIMAAYKANKIYTTPVVTIIPEERFVSVGGDVRLPQRVIYTPDMTLTAAINAAGGFTEYAKRGAVRILRGQQVIQVDANAAARNPGSDPSLHPGDQVYVPRTMF